MKQLSQIVAVVFLVFMLASCGDSHDKLMNDQISWIEDMTETLNSVSDGSISSSDATERIEALGQQADKFVERKKVLNEGVSPEQMQEVGEKYSKEIGEALQEYMTAIAEISQSGRMTEELAKAVENMKTP